MKIWEQLESLAVVSLQLNMLSILATKEKANKLLKNFLSVLNEKILLQFMIQTDKTAVYVAFGDLKKKYQGNKKSEWYFQVSIKTVRNFSTFGYLPAHKLLQLVSYVCQ